MGEFIKTREDTQEMLDFIDKAFDPVALTIQPVSYSRSPFARRFVQVKVESSPYPVKTLETAPSCEYPEPSKKQAKSIAQRRNDKKQWKECRDIAWGVRRIITAPLYFSSNKMFFCAILPFLTRNKLCAYAASPKVWVVT